MGFHRRANGNSLFSVITNMIDAKLSNAHFDRTYKSTVIDIPSSDMVTVIVNGKNITLPCQYSVEVGDAVFITIPSNIDELAYISHVM